MSLYIVARFQDTEFWGPVVCSVYKFKSREAGVGYKGLAM